MLASVLKMMGKTRPEAEGLELFGSLLFERVAAAGSAPFDNPSLAAFATAAFDHLIKKPHKRHSIGFRSTDLGPDAQPIGGPPRTVLEILDDDMPFLVESVTGELLARGIVPHLVLHPIFKVKRYGSGRLQAVVGRGDQHWTGGDQESYVAVVIDPIADAQRDDLVAALDLVLEDVRSAVSDQDAMRKRLAQAASAYAALKYDFTAGEGAPDPAEVREAADFLRWLTPANFTLTGVRDYELVGLDERAELWPASAGALGIARRAGTAAGIDAARPPAMSAALRAVYSSPQPLIFSKTREPSTVRRRAPLDRIGIKRYTPNGKLIGETRLYGQFTPTSYLQPIESVPLLRLKVRQVLAAAGFPPESHDGRTLVDILENFPRDELLQVEPQLLTAWGRRLVDLELRPRTALLLRRDEIGRTTSALVFVPRDHYDSDVRARIGRLMEEVTGGRVSGFFPYISANPLVRTHLIIADGEAPPPALDAGRIEARICELVTTWDERLTRLLAGRAPTAALLANFVGAFPAGYMETFTGERALEDIQRIERLADGRPAAIDFYRDPGAPARRVRAALYRYDEPIPLSERVPILENLGFRVIDERSYRIRPTIGGRERDVVLHDMMLELSDGVTAAEADGGNELLLEDAFMAVFKGEAENDPFNALVAATGLDWRQAAVLRALAFYLRQIRAPFGPRYIAETLLRYPAIARDLMALLAARHEPQAADVSADALRARIDTAIGAVAGLDEDRILRRLASVVLAIVRTNAMQRCADGSAPAVLAFKFASADIDRLPEPKPYREIWVYSPRVEGIHLRFGPIARGGIRWSDRPQDFRTEVLGLAKAQQVKNTVIVPTGAKGGFVVKNPKRGASREEAQAEGIACYRLFIEALLSLTDTNVAGAVVPAPGIVRLDGDDPYLVVAADKGTATFSDTANAISMSRGFWLGDAFASGGSAGYDHKRMGITARGAWECVKRHFREMDIDIQTTAFRVVGVGDMSGDVFGNAMLLSHQIRLLAAFDHRDIFIDPAPVPAVSFAERRRLADLPRSSWADYDRSLISAGGGVFSRSAKSIALSPETKAILGVSEDSLAPAELIQAILRAETDLLWFGGIGTYIRESNETDDQVNDHSNDAVRITGAEIRAKVIGEGANLAMTQRARIEAARRGVRLNTDFIDNSAGVNTSDQEVNIKIALAKPVGDGRLSADERNGLLAAMSNSVAGAVLANNHAQSLALSLAERASRRDIGPFAVLARHLEDRRLIDRRLEALPTGAELSQRAHGRSGLTRPELAVLMSWAKIALNADILADGPPIDDTADDVVAAYFPPRLRERFGADALTHPLRREIVATTWTNTIVNRAGPETVVRLAQETRCSSADVVRAVLCAMTICDTDAHWTAIGALDGKVPGALQLDMYETEQTLLVAQARRWLSGPASAVTRQAVAARGAQLREVTADLASLLPASVRTALEEATAALLGRNVPAPLATRHAGAQTLLSVIGLAADPASGAAGLKRLARSEFATRQLLRVDEIAHRAGQLAGLDPYDAQAVSSAVASLRASRERLLDIAMTAPDDTTDMEGWLIQRLSRLAETKRLLGQILADPVITLGRLAVAAESAKEAVSGLT